jgi:hypothetical protein
MAGASAVDNNVPAAARKALADMKDFLPYRGYRLLDSQWILGAQRSTTRLRGPNDQEYELTLRGTLIAGSKLSVMCRLADPSMTVVVPATAPNSEATAGRLAALQTALREAEAEALRAREVTGDRRAEAIAAANKRVEAIRRELSHTEQEAAMKAVAGSGRAVIDTSFSMDIGETVVVGTSRVAGDKALIMLLTAVPHAGR